MNGEMRDVTSGAKPGKRLAILSDLMRGMEKIRFFFCFYELEQVETHL
jgi:hypothetical protein